LAREPEAAGAAPEGRENVGLWRDRPYVIYSVRLDELAAWRVSPDGYEPLPLA